MSKSRSNQLVVRKRGIGGTDVGAIFGLNKWMSLPRLWLLKTGRLFNQRSSENEFMEWGRYLEGPVARRYSEKTGRKIRHVRDADFRPRYPWVTGNPDRIQWDRTRPKSSRRGVLEVKTAMFGKLREWSKAGVPAQYYLQLQHYLELTGLDWGSFAVLFGGNKLVEFDVPRDEKLIDLINEKEREFWDYVERDQPPPMQLGAEWNAELVNYFPKPKQAELLRLDSLEAQGRALRLLRVKQQVAVREKEINEHEAWFKLQLADHATAQVRKLARIAWTPGEQRRVDLDWLRAQHPSIATAMTVLKPTRRFSIKALSELPEDAPEEEASESVLIVSARRIELD